jgi:two-component sensor histidine kinase
MVISDNGVGLAPGVDLQRSSSLGIVLVKTLVKQLHGAIEVETKSGMSFTIKFNKIKH